MSEKAFRYCRKKQRGLEKAHVKKKQKRKKEKFPICGFERTHCKDPRTIGLSKIFYASEEDAELAIKSFAICHPESKKKPIRSYYCEYCGGWHVTSKLPTHEYITKG